MARDSSVKNSKFPYSDSYLAKNNLTRNSSGYLIDASTGRIAKKTTKLFKYELHQNFGNDYLLKGEYLGSKVVHTFTHSCGLDFQAKANLLLLGRAKCPCSTQLHVHTFETHSKQILELWGGKYLLNIFNGGDKYTNNYKHNPEVGGCGGDFDAYFGTMAYRKVCPKCPCCDTMIGRTVTCEIANDRLSQQTNDFYFVEESYVNIHTPCKIIHKGCNKPFVRNPSEFLRYKHKFCPGCHGEHGTDRMFLEEDLVRQRVKDKDSDWDLVSGTFNGINRNATFVHKCGNTITRRPAGFFKNPVYCITCDGGKGPGAKHIMTYEGVDYLYQGFEDQTRLELFKKYKPSSIISGHELGKRLSVNYMFKGETLTYFPDFHVWRANLVVESKCLATLGIVDKNHLFGGHDLYSKNQAKAAETLRLGYKYEFHLYDEVSRLRLWSLPNNWYKLPILELAKILVLDINMSTYFK